MPGVSIQADHNLSHNYQKFAKQKDQKDQELLQRNQQVVDSYLRYRTKVAKVWGKETVLPSAKVEVTYRDKLQQRSVVDYEHGTVKVELALQPSVQSKPQLQQQMASAIEQALLQAPDDRSIIEISKNPEPPGSTAQPVLKGLVKLSKGEVLTPEDIVHFKEQQAKQMQQRKVKGDDGQFRVILSTQFELVPNHIRIRAEKYRYAVDTNSLRYNLPAPLVYAIIETESFFNPRAKSPVPAFGLMQLVPTSGARDAYRFVYSKDKVVNDTYLYNSNNNIKLGTAYLHLLYFRYLRRIKNPQSRQWAAVAAYNTGVDNVVESFSGKYSKKKFSSRWYWKRKAIKQINTMKPEQVFHHLRKHLPYNETRLYIKKVRERMGKYSRLKT